MFQAIWTVLTSGQFWVGALVGIIVITIVAKKNKWIVIGKK